MEQIAVREPAREQAPRENRTGIPRQMKLEAEAASGLSFDDVRVHYNSGRPAAVGALAYTQGAQVFLGPGQERHLRHELGHVAQQKQGRVRPTVWVNGFAVNDDPGLEREADGWAAPALPGGTALQRQAARQDVVQRVGEEEAINATIAAPPLRRGNRRGSISDTHGQSYYLLSRFRAWFKENLWNPFCGEFCGDGQRHDLALLKTLVYGEAVRHLGAANCGEFSAITFAYLAQNTQLQWVYRCKMEGETKEGDPFDHAFTITSPEEFAVNAKLPREVARKDAVVVDGWANYTIATLGQFCEGENPYGAALEPEENIKVVNRARAGTDRLTPEMQRFVQEKMAAFRRAHRAVPPGVQKRAEESLNTFDFPRPQQRAIRDLRDPAPAYLRDEAGEADRHTALDKMTETQRINALYVLRPEQGAAYLRYLYNSGQELRIIPILLDPRLKAMTDLYMATRPAERAEAAPGQPGAS